jgi:anti-sigma factor RsiW
MNCPMESRNTELLVAYAAGELDLETAAALEPHLTDCPACRSLAAAQGAVWKAMDVWEAPPVSPDFDERLYSRIRREARSSWMERLSRALIPMSLSRALPLTAMACLLLVAGVLLKHPGAVTRVEPSAEAVRVDQVEHTLDDLELLQFGIASQGESKHADAM